MSKIVINGSELEFDALDADTVEAYEKALENVNVSVERIQSEKDIKLSDSIRQQCEAVFDFFDDVFGDGTSDILFDGHCNLNNCLDAFEICITSVDEQKKAFTDKFSKYMPNREQRRAQIRAVRHE